MFLVYVTFSEHNLKMGQGASTPSDAAIVTTVSKLHPKAGEVVGVILVRHKWKLPE